MGMTMNYFGLSEKYGKPKKKKQKQSINTLQKKCEEQVREIKKLKKELSIWKEMYNNVKGDSTTLLMSDLQKKAKEGWSIIKNDYLNELKSKANKNTYSEELKDKRWTKKKIEVWQRYGYQCAICGSKENIDVHHLSYEKGKKAWEYPTENFIPLCRECHKKVHDDKNHKFYPKYLP